MKQCDLSTMTFDKPLEPVKKVFLGKFVARGNTPGLVPSYKHLKTGVGDMAE